MNFLEKIKAKFTKPYIPRSDIPEQNDKDKAADKKGIWDAVLLMALEAIFFVAMFTFARWVLEFGFLLGLIITVVMVVIPLFGILLLKMRATEKRHSQLGQYPPINLVAFNKDGKKYEDHFFLKNLDLVEGSNPGFMIYLVEGAFRKNKPLEHFAVSTKHEWGKHVERNDATETVNLGSVAIEKDMPTVVLRQIGEYGEHNLPLTRVESSCVSRRDQTLFSATLKDVVDSDDEIDSYQSKEKDKRILSLEKTVASLEKENIKLMEDREKDHVRRVRKREIGEEQDEAERKQPTWQIVLPWAGWGITIAVVVALGLLFIRVAGRI
jgi:hypothetical protein